MTPRTLPQSKITPAHLRRQALVYIRQSSTQQVRSHQESKGLSKINLAIPCYTPGILMLEVGRWN